MDGNNKALCFTIEIINAQFLTAGHYFLILRITGSKVNRSKLKLFVGNSKLPLEDHEFTTDAALDDGDPETITTFTDSVISFWMPPESVDGDIQLVVEAFRLPENPMHEGDKYGEAVFNVFPRKGALFSAVGTTTPLSEDSSEVYQFETNITLSQVQESEGFWINSGVIRASVKLKYEEPEQTKPVKKAQPLPVPREPQPGPSTAPDTPIGIRTIQESALGSHVNSIPVHHLCGSYTAREGCCEVVVLAHGALGLPFKSDGRPPQPYIVGKSGKAEAQMQMGQSVTHAAIQPTHAPSWEELLLIEVKEEESKDEVVILLVADHPSKELLTEYTVPLGHLKPFHQYHLELVQPNSELSGDIRLYITLMKKLDKLPLSSVGSKMYGLEVLLRGLEAPVSSQMGPLVATGRIVSNWTEYNETMLSTQPRSAGVTVNTIHFPSPHPTSFAVAGVTHVYGAPQVTTAADPQEQPQWNQTMFFLGDESSLFTATSALVVEYYPASLAMTRDCWQLSSPVGYSYQTMDQLLFSSLKWDSGRLGLRVDNLPIEGSNLRTAVGTGPTVGMVLRLVTNERPDQLLSAAHLSSLPVFRAAPQTSQLGQPLSTQKPEPAEQLPYGLPPMNAVKTILPQFHSLYNAPNAEPVKEYVPLADVFSPPERG